MKKIPIFLITSSIIIFLGCGYKPSAYYVDKVLGKRIYATVKTVIQEPENSLLIEDALKEALKTRLNVDFVSKKNAESELEISLKKLKFRPLQHDEYGYVILYRVEITLKAKHKYYKNGVPKISFYNLEGFYEFPISSQKSSSISLSLKFDAIKYSALKALDTLIPKLALKG
jgi:hypothetical protein